MTQFSSGRWAALTEDPAPYRAMMSYRRWEARAQAPGTVALVFDPRPTYAARRLSNRENPALAHFRELHGRRKGASLATAAAAWASGLRDMTIVGAYSKAEGAHAREVLSRLARLSDPRD